MTKLVVEYITGDKKTTVYYVGSVNKPGWFLRLEPGTWRTIGRH